MDQDLVVDDVAYTIILRKMRGLLTELADQRMSPKARDILREAYGMIGDDTRLGVCNLRVCEVDDGLTGDSK